MAYDKVIDSAKLDVDITTIADAIRARSGASGKLAFPNGMADAVRNISSGAELPALDNPASPADMVKGKKLYDDYGNLVTGTVVERTDDLYKSVDYSDWESEYDPEEGNYCMRSTMTVKEDAVVRAGASVNNFVWGSELGTARPEDVAQGVTFTSENGLKIEGGMERLGTPLQENNPTFEIDGECDFGIRFKLDKPKYLDGDVYLYHSAYDLFGTATPDQVAQGVTFTSESGLKIEGTLESVNGIDLGIAGFPEGVGGDELYVEGWLEKKVILNNGGWVGLHVKPDGLGNAEPGDVRKGKYFTSSSGVYIPGEWEPEVGGSSSGQYCWKKYTVTSSYQETSENLGTTAPSDLGSMYYNYEITDDGYYQLTSGTASLNTYHLPTGAINGKTKYIYYKQWGYQSTTYYK